MSILCFLAAYLHRIGKESLGPFSPQLRRLNAGSSEMLCNGRSDLCDMPADQAILADFSPEIDPELVTGEYDPRRSLDRCLNAGLRAIDLHASNCNGEMKLFQKPCICFGEDTVQERLSTVADFLDANPHEVIKISIHQLKASTKTGPLAQFSAAHRTMPVFDEMLYVIHDGSKAWPTLRELIKDGKRIILVHKEVDVPSTCSRGACTDDARTSLN